MFFDKPSIPKYCSNCGLPLAIEAECVGYDEKTGAKILRHWLRCPQSPSSKRIVSETRLNFCYKDSAARYLTLDLKHLEPMDSRAIRPYATTLVDYHKCNMEPCKK